MPCGKRSANPWITLSGDGNEADRVEESLPLARNCLVLGDALEAVRECVG